MIPNKKETKQQKKEQLDNVLAFIHKKNLAPRTYMHEDTNTLRIHTFSLNTYVELRMWLLTTYPDSIPTEQTELLIQSTWPAI